jgi:hypothetical protein
MDIKLSFIFKKYGINNSELEEYRKMLCKRFNVNDTVEKFINKSLDLVDKNKIPQIFVLECLMLIASSSVGLLFIKGDKYWDKLYLLQIKWKLNNMDKILCNYIEDCTYTAEQIINKILFNNNEVDDIIYNNYYYIQINTLKQYYNVDDIHEICINLVNGFYRKKLPPILDNYLGMVKKYMFSYCHNIKELKYCVEYYKLNICDNCINYHCDPRNTKSIDPDPNICIWLLENGAKPNALSVSNISKSLLNKNRPKLQRLVDSIQFILTN